jgi:hypothetical protein
MPTSIAVSCLIEDKVCMATTHHALGTGRHARGDAQTVSFSLQVKVRTACLDVKSFHKKQEKELLDIEKKPERLAV